MDPFGLLLLSLGPTRMALRGISSSFDTGELPETADFSDRCLSGKPRASGLRAVSKASIRPRRLLRNDSAGMVEMLTKLATAEGLMVSAQVSLAALFEIDGSNEAMEALEARAVDLVLSTADGIPICGIEITSSDGPKFRDHTRAKAFANAGLKLVTIPANADLQVVSERLCAALGIDMPAAPQPLCLPAPQPGEAEDQVQADIRAALATV